MNLSKHTLWCAVVFLFLVHHSVVAHEGHKPPPAKPTPAKPASSPTTSAPTPSSPKTSATLPPSPSSTPNTDSTDHAGMGNWASSLIWGRNHEAHDGEIFNLNGYVAESTINFLDRNYIYTRLELADKNQLLRDADREQLGITDHHPSFRIGAYTFGGARDIWNTEKHSLAIGSDVTFYSKPSILDPIYGTNPVSWKFFIRVRPQKMTASGMHGTH